MRKSPSTPERANRSADSRLKANQTKLQEAYRRDVAAGPAGKQRHQICAATEWLRSELTAIPDADRQRILDHVITLCQDANTQARRTVIPA